MIVLIECFILCIVFTLMVFVMAKNPIDTLYNYPPKIRQKVESMEEYKDKIPTTKNMIGAKFTASIMMVIIVSLILRYINNYTIFIDAFKYSFIIWTVVNIYDVVVMDILWFCQSDRFVFKGTEDIRHEYRNYWFHIKGGIIGQVIGTIVCLVIACVVGFVL